MIPFLIDLLSCLSAFIHSRYRPGLESLALRHELNVPHRPPRARSRLPTSGCILWVWLSQPLPTWGSPKSWGVAPGWVWIGPSALGETKLSGAMRVLDPSFPAVPSRRYQMPHLCIMLCASNISYLRAIRDRPPHLTWIRLEQANLQLKCAASGFPPRILTGAS
jgi:hypothetical protein